MICAKNSTGVLLLIGSGLFFGNAFLQGASPVPGWNTVPMRGMDQDVMLLPAPSSTATAPSVLFLPGDAGWRGFAVEMASAMAASGYSVYGLDTKKYLSSFTDGKSTLTTGQISRDMHALIRWIVPGRGKLLVVGWSQGAAMAVLAAQGRGGHRRVSGVVAVSLPTEAALGWSRLDTMMSIFRKRPHQPHFALSKHLGSVAPVGLYMIYAEKDDFTPPDQAQVLFRAAKEPKQYLGIPGANHSFDQTRQAFWDALQRGLAWGRESN